MNSYLIFKSLHLIAVISWMAGLLYLPRIFVYHSENSNEIITNVFKTMERISRHECFKVFFRYNWTVMLARIVYTWFKICLLVFNDTSTVYRKYTLTVFWLYYNRWFVCLMFLLAAFLFMDLLKKVKKQINWKNF